MNVLLHDYPRGKPAGGPYRKQWTVLERAKQMV